MRPTAPPCRDGWVADRCYPAPERACVHRLVCVYFVGSVALGGYVPAESDVDIAAVSRSALSERQKHTVVRRPRTVFADVPRPVLLTAMSESMAWHRAHQKATLYSVLNACRAWRFAEEDILGSKLEGATWARTRSPDTDVIDTAVALRHGVSAVLDQVVGDTLVSTATTHLRSAARG
jgi:hypothetical protein